ncbi:hypothetical protein CcCBS67573_g10489, partial [Chytriomyces confervae]
KTLDYLFHTVIAEHGLQESQPFVRDRTRGIRNDFTLQNYRHMEAITCHERIARYHIVVASQLIAHEGFSLQQEMEQIRKTLQSLREYYTDMRKESIPCPNEAEFQAYYILSHIWNNDIATLAETLPFHIFNDPRVQLALEFQHLAQCSTAPVFKGMKRSLGSLSFYTRFFAKVADTSTSYLVAALLHQEFDRVRCNALRSMNRVLWDLEPRVSLLELAALLGYNDVQEVATVLEYYEVKVEETMEGERVACLGKDPPTKNSKLKSKSFQDGKRVSLQPRPSIRLVGSKATGVQIQDIIDGFDVGLAKPVPPPEGYNARSSVAAPFTPPTVKKQISATIKSFSDEKPMQNWSGNNLTTSNGQVPSSSSTTNTISSLPISDKLQPAVDASKTKSSAFGGSSVFGSSVFGPKAVGAKSGVFSNLSPSATEFKSQNETNSAIKVPNPAVESNNHANPIELPTFLRNPNNTAPAVPSIQSVVPPGNNQGFFAGLTADHASSSAKQFPTSNIAVQPTPPALPTFSGFGALNSAPSLASSANQLSTQPTVEVAAHSLSKEPQPPKAPISFNQLAPPFRIDPTLQQSQPIPTSLSAKPQPATSNEVDLINSFIDDEILTMLRESVQTDQFIVQPWANELILQVLDDQTASIVQEVYESLQVAHTEAVAADCLRRQAGAFRIWFCVAQRRAVKREEGEKRRREKAARFYRDVLLGSAFLNGASLVSQRPKKVASTRFRINSASPPPRPLIDVTQFMYLDIPKLILEPLWTKTYAPINQSVPPKEKATPSQLQWKLVISTPSFYTQNQQDVVSDFNRIASLWTCSKFGAGGDGSGDSRVGMAPSRWIADDTADESDSWRHTGRHSSCSNQDGSKEVGGYVLHELRRLCIDLQVTKNLGMPLYVRKAAAKDVRLSVHVTHVHVAQEAGYPLKENHAAVSSGTRAVLFQLSVFDWEAGIEMR